MINQAPIICTERLIGYLLIVAVALVLFSQVPAIAEKLSDFMQKPLAERKVTL